MWDAKLWEVPSPSHSPWGGWYCVLGIALAAEIMAAVMMIDGAVQVCECMPQRVKDFHYSRATRSSIVNVTG